MSYTLHFGDCLELARGIQAHAIEWSGQKRRIELALWLRTKELLMLGRRPKYIFPFAKVCEVCDATFEVNNRYQAARNKTCSKKCNGELISKAKTGKVMPLELRKGREISCFVCGKLVWKPEAWLRNVKNPMCSSKCNGQIRGKEWAKHAHKGRAAWKPESEQGQRERWTGSANPAWKGGVTYHKRKGKYANQSIKYVRCPQEYVRMARKDGYVMEHRLLVGMYLERNLSRSESVHHVNHVATDNRIENLMLFATNGEHKSYEHTGNPMPLWCGSCKSSRCKCAWRLHLEGAVSDPTDPRQLELL